jgi:hypothetical protein
VEFVSELKFLFGFPIMLQIDLMMMILAFGFVFFSRSCVVDF